MKIVVLDGYALNQGDLSWSLLGQLGQLEVYERTSPEDVLKRIDDATAVFTNKVLITKSIIEQSPNLRYIGVMATGYNVVDLDAANRAGVIVSNIPAYSTDSVAQLVFSFILSFTNQVTLHSADVTRGGWSQSPDFSYRLSPLTELTGKVIGIIGFGKIGQKVAQIAHAFGMQVLFQNRSDKSGLNENWHQVELNELLSKSDFVSLNCPLTDENFQFMDAEKFLLMKRGAVLINTGRGPLINEVDLATALRSGHLGGAGLDVLSKEPPLADNPLLSAVNCLITPHIAWATLAARERLMNILVKNFEAYLENKPQNIVNNPIS